MAATLADHGKVDSLFANAGVGGVVPFVDMTLDEWRRVMAVNLDGAFLTLRAAARHLVERGEGGSLVGVSSVSAIHGAPRMEHYAASKTALLALVRGLAVELARHRVRCNALLPGWTDTDMIEAARPTSAGSTPPSGAPRCGAGGARRLPGHRRLPRRPGPHLPHR